MAHRGLPSLTISPSSSNSPPPTRFLHTRNKTEMAYKMSSVIPNMMPKDFLYSLPRVHNLTSDDKCPICLENYRAVQAPASGIFGHLVSMVRGPEPIDTEAEYAVRLPCQHVFGINCIKRWVSPVEGGHSTCPYVSTPSLFFRPARSLL